MEFRSNEDRLALPARFAIIRLLGAGAMGEVYEAVDRDSGTRVAVKVLLADPAPDAVDRLKHEFRAQAELHHPNLATLGELFEYGGHWCFSMELVEGTTWMEWVTRAPEVRAPERSELDDDEPTPVRWDPFEIKFQPRHDGPRLWDAIGQLAEALAAIHGEGWCHRDIKPSNVLVTRDGRVVVLDFGLAAAFDRGTADAMAGTVDYMAPEQARGDSPSPATDLYAVGAMIYEALVGRPPFDGTSNEVLTRKLVQDPVPPKVLYPELDPGLDRLCMALLARDPARRPTSAQLLAAVPASGRTRRAGVAPGHRRMDALFYGRRNELARLRAPLEPGGVLPALASVVGVPGIGTSALLRRFAAEAGRGGVRVGLSRCREREHVRYNAWDDLLEIISRTVAALPRDQQRALLPDDVTALARVFPAARRLVGDRELDGAPAATLERAARGALRELMIRLTREVAMVLIVDDAQWMDRESLELLDEIVRPPGARVLVVVGHRPPASESPLETWLDRVDGTITRVFVGPLPGEETRELARGLVGDGEAAVALAAASAGNPLLLELLAAASEGKPAADINGGLEGVIGELDGPSTTCLRAMAIASGPLTLSSLTAVAGGDPEEVGRTIAGLRHRRLLHTTGGRRTDLIELDHEVIRAMVLARMSASEARALHHRLAENLESSGTAVAEVLVVHWLGAGEIVRAVGHAGALVASARHALDFARAGRLCEQILSAGPPPALRGELLSLSATAMMAAGELARAGSAFLMAIPLLAGPARDAAERGAAECLLRTGRVEEGLAVARNVARGLGIPIDPRPGPTLRRLIYERARLRLRGLSPNLDQLRPDRASAADACHALSLGLTLVDVVRAALYHAAALRHALDSGSVERVARELAFEAAFVAMAGARARPRALALADRAAELAAQAERASLIGVVETVRASIGLLTGYYEESVGHADRARAIYRTRCAGVAWEEHSGEAVALWSLARLGRFRDLEMRRARLEEDAATTGDQFGLIYTSLGPATFGLLGTGEIAEVRDRLGRVRRQLTPDGFQSAHAHALVTEVTLGLMTGAREAGLGRLAEAWPALRSSRILRLEQLGTSLVELRGRAVLASAGRDPARLAEALRWARRCQAAPWARGPAALIEAEVARRRGRTADARRRFAAAIELCEGHGLALHVAAARWRAADLLTGGDADRARDAALAAATELGLTRPAPVLELLSPGG